MRACLGLLGVLHAVALGGCGHSEAPRPATAAPSLAPVAAMQAEQAPDRDKHMLASFWMAIVARDALIDGDLAQARHAARELAHHDYGNLPQGWRHWVDRMQQDANEVVLAAGVADAAQAMSKVALRCGDCHAQLRDGPPLEQEALEWKEPPDTLDERMLRHERGADQLWLGLVYPSESAWRSGTVSLTRAPLSPPVVDGDPVDPMLAARIEAMRGLARRARAARSWPERAQVYAEMLARCAECHYALRPPP